MWCFGWWRKDATLGYEWPAARCLRGIPFLPITTVLTLPNLGTVWVGCRLQARGRELLYLQGPSRRHGAFVHLSTHRVVNVVIGSHVPPRLKVARDSHCGYRRPPSRSPLQVITTSTLPKASSDCRRQSIIFFLFSLILDPFAKTTHCSSSSRMLS